MTLKNIIVFIALFAIAAAAKLESKHPPHNHGHHHHDVLPVDLDPEVAPANMLSEQPSPVQEEIDEDNLNDLESQQQEDMVEDEPQNNLKRSQEENLTEDEPDVSVTGLRRFLERTSIPTKCDALTLPRYSCYNCYSYLVCKPDGGKIKSCSDPYAPYCNNGICSQTPSDACANL